MRCKNSKCRDPNSARMLLLPATAQPQLLLEPLEDRGSPGQPPAGWAGSPAESNSDRFLGEHLRCVRHWSRSFHAQSHLILPGGGAYDSPVLLMRMEVPGWRGPNPGLCLICSTLCFCCQAARIRRVGLSRLVAELPWWHTSDAKFAGDTTRLSGSTKTPGALFSSRLKATQLLHHQWCCVRRVNGAAVGS